MVLNRADLLDPYLNVIELVKPSGSALRDNRLHYMSADVHRPSQYSLHRFVILCCVCLCVRMSSLKGDSQPIFLIRLKLSEF